MIDERLGRIAYEEYLERLNYKKNIPDILDYNFPKQVEFIKHPSRRKVLFCTRRSAKSYTAGTALIHTALHNERCNALFIGLTRDSAKSIIWKDVLKEINNRYSLGAIFNESELKMTLPNQSEIKLTGVDATQEEMKKLLGRKFKIVCIDEASMYSISLSNLVDLLEPSLVDEDGTLCLMGTASNFPRGIFFEITTGKIRGWKLFQWSAYDNPYVAKKWAQALEKIKEDRPEYMETPQFKQWYLNEWMIDDEKLVYRFDMEKNLCNALPHVDPSGWTYVLGVDTGWEDDTALVLTGYHTNDPYLYVLRIFKKKKMTFDDVSNKILEYMADPDYPPHKIVIDGANKQGVESMRHRSSIPFEYADKKDKVTFIELCNSDLIQGKIKIFNTHENRPLWEEMSALVWQTDGDEIKYPKKEHPSLPNHLCDAFLYAWRCGWHHASVPAIKKVIAGSRQWYEEQAKDIWTRERERLENQNEWPMEGSLGDLG